MTIDKAIAILEALYRGGMSPSDPNPKDALKLGIEALKDIQRKRKAAKPQSGILLLGETED